MHRPAYDEDGIIQISPENSNGSNLSVRKPQRQHSKTNNFQKFLDGSHPQFQQVLDPFVDQLGEMGVVQTQW